LVQAWVAPFHPADPTLRTLSASISMAPSASTGSGLLLRLAALALIALPAAGVTGHGRMVDDILAAEPPQSPHQRSRDAAGHTAGPAPLLELGSNESVHRRPSPMALALGARGSLQQLGSISGATSEAASGKRRHVDKISLYHWSPHWQCFAENHNGCKQKAKDQLTKDLTMHDVDFANVIEMTDYTPPDGYKMVKSETCPSRDALFILYKEEKWTASGAATSGCMNRDRHGKADRAFLVTTFTSKGGEPGEIVVAGAHFPHPTPNDASCSVPGTDKLGDAIKQAAANTKKVIFMADSNLQKQCPSNGIAEAISMPNAQSALSSNLVASCCWENKNGHGWAMGEFHFDRIVASFGKSLDDFEMLYNNPVPKWAGKEMHAGLTAKLTLG